MHMIIGFQKYSMIAIISELRAYSWLILGYFTCSARNTMPSEFNFIGDINLVIQGGSSWKLQQRIERFWKRYPVFQRYVNFSPPREECSVSHTMTHHRPCLTTTFASLTSHTHAYYTSQKTVDNVWKVRERVSRQKESFETTTLHTWCIKYNTNEKNVII